MSFIKITDASGKGVKLEAKDGEHLTLRGLSVTARGDDATVTITCQACKKMYAFKEQVDVAKLICEDCGAVLVDRTEGE
tara:strand:- start:5522 stop:5758 length:237 start_codon:yes stop_codon:yes gene_type:complete